MKKSIYDFELKDFDLYPIWKTAEYDANENDELVEPFRGDKETIKIEEDYWVRIKGELNDGTSLFGMGQINI